LHSRLVRRGRAGRELAEDAQRLLELLASLGVAVLGAAQEAQVVERGGDTCTVRRLPRQGQRPLVASPALREVILLLMKIRVREPRLRGPGGRRNGLVIGTTGPLVVELRGKQLPLEQPALHRLMELLLRLVGFLLQPVIAQQRERCIGLALDEQAQRLAVGPADLVGLARGCLARPFLHLRERLVALTEQSVAFLSSSDTLIDPNYPCQRQDVGIYDK
jgi:hypothetical protein